MTNPEPHIASYPLYERAIAFLKLLDGQSSRLANEMLKSIEAHVGTPQATNDWSNPEEWIDTILANDQRQLAHHLWDKPDMRLNPRYIYGEWRFCKLHNFVIEDNQGIFRTTPDGQDFIKGKLFEALDFKEGLIRLLVIVADYGRPVKRGDLMPPFANFIKEHTKAKSNNSIGVYWYSRMLNLVERGFIQKTGNNYQITEKGLQYIKTVSQKFETQVNEIATKPLIQIQELQLKQTEQVRKQIADALAQMNPYAFEAFVGQLLEVMGYKNVEVTQKSRDGGVDVTADIEVGITVVREVVQVKRFNRASVGDKEVNELRGRLPRFNAIRGTIITNGKFSKPAQQSAFIGAPITLIDGDRLISLMLENRIGVEYEEIRLPKFNPDDFKVDQDTETEDIETL